jgi:hypothetical protein
MENVVSVKVKDAMTMATVTIRSGINAIDAMVLVFVLVVVEVV